MAADLGSQGLTADLVTGPEGPAVREHPMAVPKFHASSASPDSWIKPASEPLTFRNYRTGTGRHYGAT